MDKNVPVIHVAVASDEVYITPVYVLLTSIFVNNRDSYIHVHAIATGVPQAEKVSINEFVCLQGGAAYFYDISPEVMQAFPVPDPEEPEAYTTLATYCRLFLPRFVPQDIERLLYLDVDTLVTGSLKEMYQSDLGGAAAGAVMEVDVPLRSEIGIQRLADYFNAGVLLMDLPKWRAQRVSEQAITVIATFADKLLYHDQDALNVVFQGAWYRLISSYNLTKAYIPHDLPGRAHRAFLIDKVIVHYNGRNKPWHRDCENKLRFLYPEYLRQSPRAQVGRYFPKPLTRQGFAKLLHSQALKTHFNYLKIGSLWRRVKATLHR